MIITCWWADHPYENMCQLTIPSIGNKCSIKPTSIYHVSLAIYLRICVCAYLVVCLNNFWNPTCQHYQSDNAGWLGEEPSLPNNPVE